MAKRLEIINNKFTITDTISLEIEFEHSAEETKHLYSSGYVFFFYEVTRNDEITKYRSRGYLISELEDGDGNTFADYDELLAWLGTNIDVGYSSNNEVTDYIAEFENDLYIYAGYHLNTTPIIRRYKDSVVEIAQNVTNLATDWPNRLSLIYI